MKRHKWRIEFARPSVEITPGHFWEPTQMGGVWTDKEGNVLDNQDKPQEVWDALENAIRLAQELTR